MYGSVQTEGLVNRRGLLFFLTGTFATMVISRISKKGVYEMLNDRRPVILVAVYVVLFVVCLVTADVAQNNKQNDSVLGKGDGIDHPGILVWDLEAAKDTYRDTLGFTVPPRGVVSVNTSGIKTSSALFEDGSFLYLVAVNDLATVRLNRPSYLDFLEKHEGVRFLILNVSSAEGTAKFLRARGLDVNDPATRTIITPGAKEPPPPIGWAVTFNKPILPADSISFFQPASATAREERIRQADASGRSHHANTAKRVAAVWIVVPDLEAATKAFEMAGFHAVDKRKFSELGALGREIEAGTGRIVLLEPKGKTGKAASFLAERGEGIMGVSLEVASLATARSFLEKNTRRKFASYSGPYGDSILIPADLADGVWIEMFQKKPKP
jgi:catechol 2,3-dioxygenase-like lactoylglutathione lyase family enzyme